MTDHENIHLREGTKKKTKEIKRKNENHNTQIRNLVGLQILNYYLLIIFAALDSVPYALGS